MSPALRQAIQLIIASCIGAVSGAGLADPESLLQTPAAWTAASAANLGTRVTHVRESVANIERDRTGLRQRIRKMETLLLRMEIASRDVNNSESSKSPHWAEPQLASAGIPVVSSATALALQIDVPEASIVATTPSAEMSTLPADDVVVYDAPSLDGTLAVNDAALGEMRGGFTTSSGLQISFGIERAVYINGNLMTLTSLNVADLSKVATVLIQGSYLSKQLPTSEAAAAVAASGTLPSTSSELATPIASTVPASAALTSQSTPPSISSTAVAESSMTPSTATYALGASSQSPVADISTPATTATTTTVVQPNDNPASSSLALIQSGSGNTLPSNIVLPSGIGTIIQNSLDDQKIQTVTVVSATVNSLEILKGLDMQSTISSSVANSLKR